MPATVKPIALNNAYLVRQEIKQYYAGSNAFELVGDIAATVRFSAEPTGFDDMGFPDTILGPFPLDATIDVGVFAVVVSADDVAALAPYVGETIYQVVEGAYGDAYYNMTDVQPLIVIDPRNPGS